ncbi:MarR family transcriptional regulator [Kaistia sp. 32K]|nr:MarR family transcriptional regulator [Kaistia sp. 32K]
MAYVWRAELLKGGMSDPTPEQIGQLSLAFERFTRRFKVAEASAAMENALNALDVQALLFVNEHPDCSLGDVARNLQVALTTMSSSADRLVRREMMERQRHEANRRTVALTITPKGKEAVAGYMAGYRDACRAMLESLDPAERAEFVRLTERIANYDR